MKYAITSAIYIFGVILGLTSLVMLLIELVPMAVSDVVVDEPVQVLQDDTAVVVLRYAALISAGLWLTANVQHFAWTAISGLIRDRGGKGRRREQGREKTSSV